LFLLHDIMTKIFKSLKVKAMNIGLKFLSIDAKFAYIAFKTNSSNVRPIVILPTSETTYKNLKNRMHHQRKIGHLLNGELNGVPVSVMRAGIGNPHVAIVMEGLKRSPCKVVIRVDYCGGVTSLEENLNIADVIIPTEVFLTDGTSHSYLQTYFQELQKHSLTSYPVKTDPLTENSFQYPSFRKKYWGIQPSSSLEQLIWGTIHSKYFDFSIKSGKLWCVDALFCETESAISTWTSYGANSVDMESSIVYLLGKLYEIHTISILGISDLPNSSEWNFQKTNKMHPKYEFILDNAIDVLVSALPKINEELILH
jgi:uridine phosphorylase